MLELEIRQRDAKTSPDDLRAQGTMPAVLYGPKEDATAIAIDSQAFERLFKEAGETTIIKLKGVGDEKETLIHDVQWHPVTGKPLHADFYVLEKGKKIEINIPLEFIGQAPAEKAGHIIVKALHEVEIEVAPAELPQHLEVDISKLENVGDHITAKEIKLPPSAELKTNPEEIVVSITEFVEEKPLETEVKLAEVGEEKPEGEAAPAEGAAPAAEEKKE
ncbi:MAG TPA: 50S ribosomal protein L25 [Candidatus Paceibacterota bacterium]|nr:50S ribosomal protein L25 [Candidatus Paceibacterota bacterium]